MTNQKRPSKKVTIKYNYIQSFLFLLSVWLNAVMNAVMQQLMNPANKINDDIRELRKARKTARTLVRMSGRSIRMFKCEECGYYFYETFKYEIDKKCSHSGGHLKLIRKFEIDYTNTKYSEEGIEIIKAPAEIEHVDGLSIERMAEMMELTLKDKLTIE